MQLETRDPQRALVIVAHPDDIEFGTAGSIMKWTAAGAQVTYVLVTDGAAGSNDPDMTRDVLIPTRQREQRDAAAIAGVTDVRFLGYADGALEPTMALRRDLTRIIREVRPDRVVIMDPTAVLLSMTDEASGQSFDYINHPDHVATGQASLYAVFPSAETRPIFPELLAEGFEPHHVEELYIGMSDKANIVVDITPFIDRKIQALLAHKTQLGPEIEPMIRAWDAGAGAKHGLAYAETFRVMRFPRSAPAETLPAAAEAAPA
jgi:LmbE family N-acetylglucosaminyl deacetylase